MTKARALLLLAAAACLCCLPAAHAGCRKRKAVVPESERFFNHQPVEKLPYESLPANFSWRNKDGINFLAPSWNQHIPEYCGSCWLHGSLSMIQDRLKIAKNGLGPDVMLARQTILNCAPFHGYSEGCNGGDVIDVIRYMKHYGVPDESCMPYSATDYTKFGKKAKTCPAEGYCMNCMPLKGKDTCWPVHTPIRYYLDAYGQLDEKGDLLMMNEIHQRGPITCSMSTPETFDYGYHNGVFVDGTNYTEIDHDVEVVGWGVTEDGLKYWEIRNSWGTYWGELGFFKLQRGINALNLEAGDCWYVIPTWQDEQDIRSGKKVGTMWGIMDAEQAKRVKPEGHRKPHYKKDGGDGDESGASLDESHASSDQGEGAVQLPLKRAQQVLLGSGLEA